MGAAEGRGNFVAVLLRERMYGVHVFLEDGKALAPFPGRDAGQHRGSCIAVGADGAVHVGAAGLIESHGTDRAPPRKTRLDIGEPAALAASSDGTVYALDVRGRKIVGVVPGAGRSAVTYVIPRGIRTPMDIACDGYGTLYLLDGKARKIYELRRVPKGPE